MKKKKVKKTLPKTKKKLSQKSTSSKGRCAVVVRKTKETDINLSLNIDGVGASEIHTGIPFLDHMLDLLAKHSLIDIDLFVKGDLHVDDHHTIEDIGLVLGEALKKALGEKKGIVRYGHNMLPMDGSIAMVTLDISGRPYLDFVGDLGAQEAIGEGTMRFSKVMVKEFFQAIAGKAEMTLHIELYKGDNLHHNIEAIFKAFARALYQAVKIDPRRADGIPSTKGIL